MDGNYFESNNVNPMQLHGHGWAPGVKVCAINFAKLPPNPPSPDNVTSVAAAAADVAVEKGAAGGWCAAAEPSALPAACGHTLAAEALGKVAIVA